MTGPPCGELSRYLDEVREQRKREAAEAVVVPDNCMAMVPYQYISLAEAEQIWPTDSEVLASIDWEAVMTKACWEAVARRYERDTW